MQLYITLFFKSILLVYNSLRVMINYAYTYMLFYTNNVKFKSFSTNGIPFIMIARKGVFTINQDFKINNGLQGNPIGRPQPCVFFVDTNAILQIGKNVGISSGAIIAHKHIKIGDNVKIGGGVCIYDTDFHSTDPLLRINSKLDMQSKSSKEVIIHNNAFIGAHSTILKGVTIGQNAIVGACSVVTKSIPENEIWAGNPAKFIKNI